MLVFVTRFRFKERNLYITLKLQQQSFQYHKLVPLLQNLSTDRKNSFSNTDEFVIDYNVRVSVFQNHILHKAVFDMIWIVSLFVCLMIYRGSQPAWKELGLVLHTMGTKLFIHYIVRKLPKYYDFYQYYNT